MAETQTDVIITNSFATALADALKKLFAVLSLQNEKMTDAARLVLRLEPDHD